DACTRGYGGQWFNTGDQDIARVDIHGCIAVVQENRISVFHGKSRGICENCELDEIVRHMTEQLILDISPAPPASLDNFVAGAHQAALQALRQCSPGRAVYLWGPPGAGRTHLLRAMASQDDSRYFSSDTPSQPIFDIATDDKAPPSLLAIDDIERFDEHGQAAVFALYNRWRESATRPDAFTLLVSGDRAPKTMSVREDLRTRLGWDLVFRLEY